MISRSQSRKRKYSSSTKTKFDLLPKINKTTLLLKDKQKNNQNASIVIPTFAEKVAWVVQNKDYNLLNDRQIEEQYNKLRRELQNINLQVEKALEKLDVRILKKTKISEHDAGHTLQIRDKQIQNNNTIIDRLRKQFFQLQKRSAQVTPNSKQQLEQQIQKSKSEIQKTKQKIKQLKLKNKNIGDSIMGSDQLYEEIKRLQNQKQVNERKKYKLQTKTDHVYEQISTSQIRLEQISDNYTIAENFFSEYYGKTQLNQQQKQLQAKYQHAKHCLQVVNRKNQSTNNSKQQKYHIMLKNLQNQLSKLNTAEQKIASVELEILHCKKVIKQLEQVYRLNEIKSQQLLLNQDPIFFTQFETQTSDKNDKNQNKDSINEQKQNKQSQRNKTQNKQNYKEIKLIKSEQNPRITKQKQSQKMTKKQNKYQQVRTSKQDDPEQQGDIIVELDQKFKYKTKTNMNNSRYQKQTEIGEDLPEDVIDQDDEIVDFKQKVTEQKVQRKSKHQFDITKDISKIQKNIQKMDFIHGNNSGYSEQELN